jgi:hypothetical protein
MAKARTDKGLLVGLVVVAVVLAVGYVVLDLYSDGEKNKTVAESRGVQLTQALSRYKMEANAYPEVLDKLVPKYAAAMPKCPGGEPFAYRVSGPDYTLTCPNVIWKSKPYSFSSRTRTWEG